MSQTRWDETQSQPSVRKLIKSGSITDILFLCGRGLQKGTGWSIRRPFLTFECWKSSPRWATPRKVEWRFSAGHWDIARRTTRFPGDREARWQLSSLSISKMSTWGLKQRLNFCICSRIIFLSIWGTTKKKENGYRCVKKLWLGPPRRNFTGCETAKRFKNPNGCVQIIFNQRATLVFVDWHVP